MNWQIEEVLNSLLILRMFFKNTGNPHLLRIHNVYHSENESIAIMGSINTTEFLAFLG